MGVEAMPVRQRFGADFGDTPLGALNGIMHGRDGRLLSQMLNHYAGQAGPLSVGMASSVERLEAGQRVQLARRSCLVCSRACSRTRFRRRR